MQISKISFYNIKNLNLQNNDSAKTTNITDATTLLKHPAQLKLSNIPLNYYGTKINFRSNDEFFNPNRTVPHIDYEEYKAMSENTKKRYRKKYASFNNDKTINKNELFDVNNKYLPLQDEKVMDEFLKTSSIYKKYKDQPIICLGRSPKWFLNAALWMEDGIDKYNFVAFSKYWYRPDAKEGIVRMDRYAPTEKEISKYRKYLRRIQADPMSIVNHMRETGKKTVITDYICTGKGASSFMEILGEYAKDLGILEEFSKSIQIVGIGSMEYMEDLNPYADEISVPKVFMPEVLIPYSHNIKQEYYNVNFAMFKQMLLNQNTNECRSTFYPHEAWTIYQPDKFKTGLIKDMKKVKELKKQMAGYSKISHFTPAMFDYRNLLNFWILDNLDKRKMLKSVHHSKI